MKPLSAEARSRLADGGFEETGIAYSEASAKSPQRLGMEREDVLDLEELR